MAASPSFQSLQSLPGLDPGFVSLSHVQTTMMAASPSFQNKAGCPIPVLTLPGPATPVESTLLPPRACSLRHPCAHADLIRLKPVLASAAMRELIWKVQGLRMSHA
jgi:hypothetical protein